MISFVVTCYNRSNSVISAIESVLNNFIHIEIIVVDDASQDDSLTLICSKFSKEIEFGSLQVLSLKTNVGVTGAKNAGYSAASGDWVVFLDSDDYLLQGVGTQIIQELASYKTSPIVFFRCKDSEGNLVGTKFLNRRHLSLSEYLVYSSYGEALTAVNKSLMKGDFCYPQVLRGYEGVGCLAAIKMFGPALLSTVIARCYDTTGDDRLSSPHVFLKRSRYIFLGHIQVYQLYNKYFTFSQRILFLSKIFIYWLLSKVYK